MNWLDKNVLVMGMARSGVSASRYLVMQGARVTVNDSKPLEALADALRPLEGLPIRYALGCSAGDVAGDWDAIVVSPGVPMALPFLQAAKSQGVPVLAELEVGFQGTTCPMAAITGTNGKSTTTVLLGEILKDAGYTTYVDGNIGRPITEDASSAAPDARMVTEVSSYQLEGIDTFRPLVSAILNLTEDHLTRHKTMEGYLAAKARIFMNQRGEDVCVLNGDDALVSSLGSQVPCRTWWFSRHRQVEDGACMMDGQLVLVHQGQVRPVLPVDALGMPGDHNVENALAACVMADALGVSAASMAYTLRRFTGIEHRCEPVAVIRGVQFINDSKATNVDSTLVAIRAMKTPTVMIAGGSYKVMDYGPMARALAPRICALVLTGDTAEEIAKACADAGYTAVFRAEDMKKAVHLAFSLAKPGENVLLSPACASFDHFTDFEHRGRVFKTIVEELKKEIQ